MNDLKFPSRGQPGKLKGPQTEQTLWGTPSSLRSASGAPWIPGPFPSTPLRSSDPVFRAGWAPPPNNCPPFPQPATPPSTIPPSPPPPHCQTLYSGLGEPLPPITTPPPQPATPPSTIHPHPPKLPNPVFRAGWAPPSNNYPPPPPPDTPPSNCPPTPKPCI